MPTDAELQAMSTMIQAAMDTSTKALIKFAQTAKESAGPSGGFKQMDSALVGIAKNLAGPVGIAAGFYAAGKAVADFSDQRLKLSLFAKDVGFSADSIHGLRRAMFMAGKETADADRAISAIGGSMKDLQAKRYGAAIYSDLMQLGPGMHEVAKELLAIADTGDFDKALRLMESKWGEWGPRTRHLVAQAFHVTESDIEAGFDRLNHHIDAKTQEAAERQAKQIRYYRQMFADAWEYALGGAVDAIDRNRETLKNSRWLTPDEIKDMMFGGSAGTQPKAGEAGESWWKQMMTPKIIDQSRYSVGGDPMAGDADTPSLVGKVHGWLGRRSDVGTSGSTDFSSRGRDLIEVEADSNKTLRDIRDSLQRMEVGAGGTSGARGEGGATGVRDYSGRRGLAERAGINTSRSGGGHGAIRSGGGSAGITAPAGTPIQGDMATVTAPDGKSFQVDPAVKENFQGFIDDYYAAGGKFGPSTGTLGMRPGNASGHPIGAAIDVNQIGRGIRSKTGVTLPAETEDAIAEKWGMVSGNTWKNNDQGHFGIRSLKAARDALVARGVTPSDADKKVGLDPSGGPAVKGSWFDDRSTASGLDASKTAGIALPTREGLGKMHDVTGPDGRTFQFPQIDVGPAKWTGRGIDISRPAMDRMGYDPTDKKFTYSLHARDMVDSSRSSGGGDASMSATVDFKNMPSWVKTAVDDNGKFKNLKISRSTPQSGRAGSGLGDFSPWAYE